MSVQGERRVRRAQLQVIGAAALFSTGGLVIKLCSLDAWAISALRSGIAALTLFALLPGARTGWSRAEFLTAIPYAATLTLFVLANKYTTAAQSIFLQATAPLYVLLLSPWLLGETLRREDWWFIGALAVGMLLLVLGTGEPAATAARPTLGGLLAAASGLTWALALVGLRWLATRGRGPAAAMRGVAAGNALACALSLPLALPLPATPAADWLLVVYLGVGQVAIAYVLLTRAAAGLPALQISLLLLLEPVLNPLWVWAVLDEEPSMLVLAGGALVLLATVAHVWQLRPALTTGR